MISEQLLEVRAYTNEGYSPVVEYGNWLVAIMNYADELGAENLATMQCHTETDEVFLLLRGRCILFLAEGKEGAIQAENMLPFKLYNVKKGAWHTHALSKDATVLVIENRDTTPDNSPRYPLTTAQRQTIVDLTRTKWGKYKFLYYICQTFHRGLL